MATKVNIIVAGSYVMPPACVSCGAPAGRETISTSGSDFSGKHIAVLKFPICDACAQARHAIKWPRRWGRILGLLGGLVIGMGVARLGYALVDNGLWAWLGVAITVAGFIVGGRFAVRTVSTEEKERVSALGHAVEIKKYHAKTFGTSTAVIEFANSSFGHLFVVANPVVATLAEPVSVPVAPVPAVAQAPPSGWYPDPSGRHDRRYWDGSGWTENVDDHGVPSTDE